MAFMRPLGDTLIEMSGALWAPPGLTITEIDIEMPLEISSAVAGGRLTILGNPPHSRWEAGFLPPVHKSRFHFVLLDGGEESRGADG